MSRWWITPVLLLGLAAFAAPEEGGAGGGDAVYRTLACRQCHDPGGRRAGPVLDAPFLPRSAEWHRAHLFAPRTVAAESVMPAYAGLFAPAPHAAELAALVAKYDTRDGSMHQDGFVTRAEYERAGGRDWDGVRARFGVTDGVLRAPAPAPTPELTALIDHVAGLAAAPAPPRTRAAAPPPPDPAGAIVRGRRLYERHCAGCHGVRGDGAGPAARFFRDHPPRNFLRGEFKFRSTKAPTAPLDADLFRTIRGGAGPSMPAWPLLTDAQVWDLVEFVKSHHPGYLPYELFVEEDGEVVLAFVRGTEEEPAERADAAGADLLGGRLQKRAGAWYWNADGLERPVRAGLEVTRDGRTLRFRLGRPVFDWTLDAAPEPVAVGAPPFPYTKASAKLGARVYAEFGCASCHGPDASPSTDALGRRIRPADYTRGALWLKGGADAASLVRAFQTGLMGTPMPAYSFEGAAEAPWRLAHFVLEQAGVPYER